jgi:hypothetical protein
MKKLFTVWFVLTALASQVTALAHADAVLDWNQHAATAIISPAPTGAGKPAAIGLVDLAIVHTAIYDAVNAIAGYPFDPYEVTPIVTMPASPEAAAATAGHDTLVALFPAQQADLDAKYATSLALIPDGPAKTNGIAVGQQAAAGILDLRADDGRTDVVPYMPGSGPGAWNPTPPASLPAQTPQLATVLPWTLDNPDQFRAPGPPKLTSKKWERDYNEVKSLGRATGSTRTPEQTSIGLFWADQPLLQWNRAWRGIAIAQGLSLEENARFFALMATVSADSCIACWDSKYFYNFWRPVTAIRAGDTDGNSKTTPDTEWIGLAVTPNHPEYPAAHGCLTGAITHALRFFFGTDEVEFTIDSNVPDPTKPPPPVVRSYSSFSQALEEVLDARVYGGMHYRTSTRHGEKIGKQVARFAWKHFFRRTKP